MKIYSDVSRILLTVNNEQRQVVIKPSDTLARVLREQLGLTGTKISCETGDCGACTVQINGKPVKSCLTLAVEAIGESITTIEGIENEALKESMIRHHGFQCGYCTSGVIVNADALLSDTDTPDAGKIREYLESNLCRCTGYEGIELAIQQACKSGK